MAHMHFNGTCEQSARNYHGAISRNFGFENDLKARLACNKPVAQFNRAFSGALVPLAYDEDPEYETRRGVVFIKNGYVRAREVRAFCDETVVFAEAEPQSYAATPKHRAIPAQVENVLHKVVRKEKVSKKEAKLVMNFIMKSPRVAKPIRDKFAARKIGALAALRLAGLYSVKR